MTISQDMNRKTPHEEFDARELERQAREKAAKRVSREMNKRFEEAFDMAEAAAARYPGIRRLD